ncbi:hypothetical protein JXM67_00500 [candidate division WOR-3 bacterium]|nr:hypothetical protein [candidate division WOR-3 bacterium]
MRPKIFKMQIRLLLIVLVSMSCGRESEKKYSRIAADSLLALHQEDSREPADTQVVLIHLELGKYILALAEATMLTVAVTNNSDGEILLDNRYLFGGTEHPYSFKLFMVSPDGEEWEYIGGRRIKKYLSTSKFYFYLPPQLRVDEQVCLWATTFVPKEYRQALEKLTPGVYRLFAIYHIPIQEGIDKYVFFSDTLEFVYLPLDSSDARSMKALRQMNALSESFLGIFGSPEEERRLRKIIRTKTPYSEAAHSLLLGMILAHLDKNSYDDFVTAKTQFDRLYPNSPFEPTLLELQWFRNKSINRTSQADSIAALLENIYPEGKAILRWQNKITPVVAKDVDERRTAR